MSERFDTLFAGMSEETAMETLLKPRPPSSRILALNISPQPVLAPANPPSPFRDSWQPEPTIPTTSTNASPGARPSKPWADAKTARRFLFFLLPYRPMTNPPSSMRLMPSPGWVHL